MRGPRLKAAVLRVTVRAPVRPTEDPEKVRAAILSLFPGATVREVSWGLVADAPHLDRLRELIRSTRIPDSARGAMMAGLSEDGMRAAFLLGKQAAAGGRAHFGPLRSPLGDLEVTLEGEQPDEVARAIYRIAPDTTVPEEWAEIPAHLRPSPT
ncbi:MAG: uncharacterized protein QOE90_3454 [Thermoplasmata archaeon]|nr:uncharacterized protein [Thermoplasmata archaeon]